jgi:carboxylesterase type B
VAAWRRAGTAPAIDRTELDAMGELVVVTIKHRFDVFGCMQISEPVAEFDISRSFTLSFVPCPEAMHH